MRKIWDRFWIWKKEYFVVTDRKGRLTKRLVEDFYAVYETTTS